MSVHADRNLLFGVLALQAGLIDHDRFVEGCTLWANRKDTPLPELLLARGWLTRQDKGLVDSLLERNIEKHAGDARSSLLAVATHDARALLAASAEPAVRDSLGDRNGGGLSTVAYEPAGRERYTLSRLHAKGGIGQVWLARDDELGREVALKELRPDHASNAALAARFVEEARVTGQLEHPAIVPVYELSKGEDGRQPYYTMRFVRGQTLADAVRRYHQNRREGRAGPLELRELLNAFVAVCNAVAFAHARGVLHRDLKPQNVALGDFGEVILLDWGLAKRVGTPDREGVASTPVEADRSAGGQTVQGQVLGTPAYLPPEQAEGRLDLLDARSDVYGLGAILYEILTGRPPFAGADTQEVLKRVIHEAPVPPRKDVPSTPRALEAVCLRALSKQPDERYPGARDLGQEVQHWLADEPVVAWREPWSVRARRWLGRHRTLATATAAAVLVATVSLAVATGLLTAANERERSARAAEEQARLKAQENFRLAREAVDRGFTRVSESPEMRAFGLERLRTELLGQAKDFYENFAHASTDEPSLQAESGRAHLRLARLTADTGDQDVALRYCEQARATFARLAGTSPEAVDYQDGLAEALATEGFLYQEVARLEQASAAYAEAVAIRERLASNPGSPDFRFRLAQVLNGAGKVYCSGLGRVAEGEAAYERARAIARELAREHPGVPAYVRVQAESLRNLAQSRFARREPAKAGAYLEQALVLREQLAREQPNSPEALYDLCHTLHELTLNSDNMGQIERARDYCERARPISGRLVREHPDVPAHRDLDANIRVDYATLLVRSAEPVRAAAELDDMRREPANQLASRFNARLVLYNAACTYCQCAEAARSNAKLPAPEREKLAGRYLDSAMDLLKTVNSAGFFKTADGKEFLQRDTDLNALRQREDFKTLLRELGVEAPK